MPHPGARWLRPLSKIQTGPRLLAIPYAGGGVAAFRPLAGALAGRATVFGLLPPGREMRLGEPAIAEWDAWLAHAETAAAPLFEGPAPVLWGHSLGALAAYELARRFTARGTPPAHLVVSAGRPPGHAGWRTLAGLDDAALLLRLRKLGGTPEEVLASPDIMAMVLPTLHADFALAGAYTLTPAAPLPCPLTVLAGLADPVVERGDLQGWSAFTEGPFTLGLYSGGHFFPFQAPEAQGAVHAALARVLGV